MKDNPARARERSRRYQASKIKAAPSWLTDEHKAEMTAIYVTAQQLGLQVDHIVPLQGKNVCGLHVPWNLQPIPAEVNRQKSNRHEIS